MIAHYQQITIMPLGFFGGWMFHLECLPSTSSRNVEIKGAWSGKDGATGTSQKHDFLSSQNFI
jgi:hypothetical protein